MADVVALVAAAAREEMPRLVAAALRITRDVGEAEDCAQEALLSALSHWPESGVPQAPGAWLLVATRHRALDVLRHRKMAEARTSGLRVIETARLPDPADPPLPDDLLRLVVACCHPALSLEQQVAMALRLACGLATGEIARLMLVAEPTLAQRLVRAKRALHEHGAGWEEPDERRLAERLPAVADVAYLVLTGGHAVSEGEGEDAVDRERLAQAVRLSGLLAGIFPADSEILGIAALACLQASRAPARASGELLAFQDRSLWDAALIGRGLELLARASALGEPGPRQIEAALAACHAVAPSWDETDWARILRLYDRLLARAPSPVAELNRAVALSFAEDAATALVWLDGRDLRALASHHLFHATRADFLRRSGHVADAAVAYERALALAGSAADRAFLRRRIEECRA